MLNESSASDRLLGLPIENFSIASKPDLEKVWRLNLEREHLDQQLDEFFNSTVARECSGLIVVTTESQHVALRISEDLQIPLLEAASSITPTLQRLIEQAPNLPFLRGLWIAPENRDERCDVSLPDILTALPSLEEYHLTAGRMDSGPVRHICLRKLSIDIGMFQSLFVKSIANCVFQNLEEMEIVLGNAKTLEFLTHSHFNNLKVLRLRSTKLSDVFDWIRRVGLPESLEVLDVSYARCEQCDFADVLPSLNQLSQFVARRVCFNNGECEEQFHSTFGSKHSFSVDFTEQFVYDRDDYQHPLNYYNTLVRRTSYYDHKPIPARDNS